MITPREAVALQKRLSDQVIIRPLALSRVRFVAGADLSYDILEEDPGGFFSRRNSDVVYAAVVVLKFPELEWVDESVVCTRVNFPYLPGLLSFRESPPILRAWERLQIKPDVLLVDGHGLAHPRRFGIASHLGLLLNVPTVGCGKSLLIGHYKDSQLTRRRGSFVPLRDGKEIIGSVLRTREGVNPVFVSVGHRVNLASAREAVLCCAPKYRIPEPLRQAHHRVNEARRAAGIPRRSPDEDIQKANTSKIS